MTLAANLAALARRIVGTSANNIVALDGAAKLPAVDGSQLTGLRVVGVEQTWQDVTASRALGSVYQNTSGKAVEVLITVIGVGTISLRQGSTASVTEIANPGEGVSSVNTVVCAIVPNGWYYSCAVTGGTKTLIRWVELR